jgi:hypothetical protein
MKNLILLDTTPLTVGEVAVIVKALYAFREWESDICTHDLHIRFVDGGKNRLLLGVHTKGDKANVGMFSYSDIPQYAGEGYNIIIVEDYETLFAKAVVQLKYYK